MEDEKEQPPTTPRRVWGPLPLEISSRCGAHAPVCSFVVAPELEPDVLSAAEAEVLQDSVPASDDTLDSWVERLTRSRAFDNPRIVYARRTSHGYFRYQAQLPLRQGSQARRATYAELSRHRRSSTRRGREWDTCAATAIYTDIAKTSVCAGRCRQG